MSAILVTGANGHLGRRLIPVLAEHGDVVALVRSDRARYVLDRHAGHLENVRTIVADPGDPAVIARVAADCDRAVHLIGSIKASRANPLRAAHEDAAAALIEGARETPIAHVVYVSILGAAPTSASSCLRARAAVESMLQQAGLAATLIRVPMVLGERDRASFALAKRAAARRTVVFRGASLEQPIYAGDVVAAMAAALAAGRSCDGVFQLAGPRSLSRRDLIMAAGRVIGNRPSVISLPLLCGFAVAGVLEMTRAAPPITRDMLRILDHDDAIDPQAAAAALGISLTSLDDTLTRCISERLNNR